MTTVNQKRIRKTKTSRLSSLGPLPSKIRLSTADETELASELTDEVPIQQGESLTPVIYIPSPISPVLLRFRLMCAAGKPVSRSTFFELRIDCYTSCHSAKLRDLQKHLLNYARRVMNNLSRKNRKVIFLSLWRRLCSIFALLFSA